MSHLPERSNITLSNTSVSSKYLFDALCKTLTIKDADFSSLVTVTNLNTGDVIFNINGTSKGVLHGRVVTLDFDTTNMNDDDQLVVVYVRNSVSENVLLNNILSELLLQTEILKSIASM